MDRAVKNFLVPVFALILFAPPALAANPPLEPGRAAGVQRAQREDGTTMIVIAGVAVIAIAVALATAGNGAASPNNNPATSTTSTTP